ncbi:hypothetical protein FRC07_001541 [Ceratobasidium sp. 392]|nr:hypothetical protein FRC07_001541 [Ceratobasidium sp. 392]
MSPLISSIAWVRRGAAAESPEKYNLDEKELSRVQQLARIELEDAQLELQKASEAAQEMEERSEDEDEDDEDDEEGWEDASDDDRMDEDGVESKPKSKSKAGANNGEVDDPNDLSKYNLDNYDKENTGTASGPFSNIKGLTYYRTNDEDPYITLKEDDEEAERAELQVQSTDNMIITAKTEDEVSHLDVYIYNDDDENLYVHHDILLPSFPLCLEWLDFPPNTSTTPATVTPGQGNFIAVGTFEPEIEIWSLDTTEAIYPSLILGRPDKSAAHVPKPLGTGKKKRKQVKAREPSTAYHVDAVLSLSWNRAHRNILASASADATVKLWDLSSDGGSAVRSFDVHADKVQSVQWSLAQPEVLLTGSYDRTVRVFDSRDPEKAVGAVVGADVEALRWDPWDANSVYVALENGNVHAFDIRTLSTIPKTSLPAPTTSRFTLSAHTGAASALDINPHMRGCIATGGADKLVKIWNVDTEGGKVKASMVISRNLEVGKVFSVAFSPDDPLTLAAAGSKAKLQVWDIGTNSGARKSFGARLPQRRGGWERTRESGGVIGLHDDDEDESEAE